jgi:hypothetical protein
VIELLDASEDASNVYLFFTPCEGGDLFRRLQRQPLHEEGLRTLVGDLPLCWAAAADDILDCVPTGEHNISAGLSGSMTVVLGCQHCTRLRPPLLLHCPPLLGCC